MVDASVAFKWFFTDRNNEAQIERAMTILDALDAGSVQIIQPPHFLAEMAAVLVREKGPAAMADLEDLQALDKVSLSRDSRDSGHPSSPRRSPKQALS